MQHSKQEQQSYWVGEEDWACLQTSAKHRKQDMGESRSEKARQNRAGKRDKHGGKGSARACLESLRRCN